MSKLLSTCSAVVISICALILFSSAGCKGDGVTLAPVSGVVTAGGNPVAGIEVVFYPKPTKENPAPGPFAVGKTDSEGKFSLVARGGKKGATIGINSVAFELPAGMDQEALEETREELQELRGEPGADSAASIKEVQARIDKIKKDMKAFDFIPKKYLRGRSLEIDVPAEGLTDHPIDLSK